MVLVGYPIGAFQKRTVVPRDAAGGHGTRWAASFLLAVACACGACAPRDPLYDLRSRSAKTRAAAADQLGLAKDARAVDPLIAALQDPDHVVQMSAAAALGRLGDARAAPPLIDLMRKGSPAVAGTAEDALAALGSPAIGPLLEVLEDDASFAAHEGAARALGKMRGNAFQVLAAAIGNPDAAWRGSAIGALAATGDRRAVGLLVALLGDKDEGIRTRAVRGLADLGPVALEGLIGVVRDPAAPTRALAARALALIRVPRATEILDRAMRTRDLELVAGAYEYYIERGEPASEAVLVQALNAHGSRDMAIGFLNSQNMRLVAPAVGWATAHGYDIQSASVGPASTRWGGRPLALP